MNSNNNTSAAAAAPAPTMQAGGVPCNFRNRGLTFATFVVALAGFVGTAFSAMPLDAGLQPGACIASVLH